MWMFCVLKNWWIWKDCHTFVFLYSSISINGLWPYMEYFVILLWVYIHICVCMSIKVTLSIISITFSLRFFICICILFIILFGMALSNLVYSTLSILSLVFLMPRNSWDLSIAFKKKSVFVVYFYLEDKKIQSILN